MKKLFFVVIACVMLSMMWSCKKKTISEQIVEYSEAIYQAEENDDLEKQMEASGELLELLGDLPLVERVAAMRYVDQVRDSIRAAHGH